METDDPRDVQRCRMGLLGVAMLHWVIAAVMFQNYLNIPTSVDGGYFALLLKSINAL